MKHALALLLLFAACGGTDSPSYCTVDTECSGNDVCAHTHECLPADQVHSVTIHWTIGGQAPSATTCAGIDHLDVGYENSGDATDQVLFSPVMCNEGEFPNDKWPTRYDIADVDAVSTTAPTTFGQNAIPSAPSVDVTVDVAHP